MNELITDLALHYSLSEKQVRFLSESSFLDSFLETKSFGDVTEGRASSTSIRHTPFKGGVQPSAAGERLSLTAEFEQSILRGDTAAAAGQFTTPNRSVLSMEELSGLMRNGSFLSVMENSEEAFRDLCSQVCFRLTATRHFQLFCNFFFPLKFILLFKYCFLYYNITWSLIDELSFQVKKSNEVLWSLEPGALLSKLTGLVTPPSGGVGTDTPPIENSTTQGKEEMFSASRRSKGGTDNANSKAGRSCDPGQGRRWN